MSFEQAVTKLEQTNAALQEEVVRFRDAAMGLNAIYPTVTDGRQVVADGKYFSVPGDGAYMRLYRRLGTSAALIAEFESRASMQAALSEAKKATNADAKSAAASAALASNLADVVAEATTTYRSVAEGLAATEDSNYFRVLAAPLASKVAVYQRVGDEATLIAEYYTKSGVDEQNRLQMKLQRSLARLGDYGQTLHSDFSGGAYGLGSAMTEGVDRAVSAEEMWNVERVTPKWVWQPSGPNGEMRLTEVPPDTIAIEWYPVTGECLGVLREGPAANRVPYSSDISKWSNSSDSQVTLVPQQIEDPVFDTAYLINGIDFTVTNGRGVGIYPTGAQTIVGDTVTKWVYFKYVSGDLPIVIGTRSNALFNNLLSYSPAEDSWSELSTDARQGIIARFFERLPGGWWRVGFSQNPTDSGGSWTGFVIGWEGSPNTDGNSFALSHGQVETGVAPTSYIPTNGAPVTRAADNVTHDLRTEFNPTRFTMFVEGLVRKGLPEDPGGQSTTLNVGAFLSIRESGGPGRRDSAVTLGVNSSSTRTYRAAYAGPSGPTYTRGELPDHSFNVLGYNKQALSVDTRTGAYVHSSSGHVISGIDENLIGITPNELNLNGFHDTAYPSRYSQPHRIKRVELAPRMLSEQELSQLTMLTEESY